MGFKTILVERREQFAAALTAKVLAYATGRRAGPCDRPHVDQIVSQLADRNYGLRDLIELVATSEAFALK